MGLPKRTNFFAGRLLTAEDFSAEQDYLLGRFRRHNRLLHGSGVVQGLDVSLTGDTTTPSVTIGPGYALDPIGDEICVGSATALPLPREGTGLYVVICHRESPTDPVPVFSDPAEPDSATKPSRIADTFELFLSATSPQRGADPCGEVPGGQSGVALTRLLFSRRRWRVDRRFRVPRAR